MKKLHFALALMLALGILTSCAVKPAQPSSTPIPGPTAPNTGDGVSYIRNPSVSEYGESYTIINDEHPFYAYIRYPQADGFADKDILEWANKTFNDVSGEISRLRKEEDPTAEGEVNVQYDSYLVNGRLVGIALKGMFMTTVMANPAEIVKTFNLDLNRGVMLQNSDILEPARNVDILLLLKNKILADDIDSSVTDRVLAGMDASWLKNIVINHDGIDVVLERGLYMPTYLGTRTYTLTYEELGSAFLLGPKATTAEPPVSIAPPEPTPSDTPEPATQAPPTAAPTYEPTDNPPDTGNPPERVIDPSKPMLALTFDDGPSKYTDQLLDIVEKYNVRVTFCVIGNAIEHRQSVVARAYNMGNEVIGHTWDHRNLTKLTDEEIKQELLSTSNAIKAATGSAPKLFRPPYGAVNASVKKVSAELGYSLIYWSVDTLDWKTKNANAVYNAIMKDAKNRAIILCHDLHKTTVEAMERVIPALIEKGYQLVTVSELMEYSNIEFEPGNVYYKGK
jgi:peptidoglycan/xylan/chitin deacetylase (PgdA/CDA1 family)